MGDVQGYQDLKVYRRAMALVPRVHELIGRFPRSERFDLTSQLRRASRSIPANIAEGYAKRVSPKEFCSYLTTAMGSANEMEVHLQMAGDLGYVPEACRQLREEYAVVGKQLNRLIASWRSRPRGTSNQSPATRN